MKLLLLILLFLISYDGFRDIGKINELKKQAQQAYQNKNYSEAAENYKKLINDFEVNDEKVLINLANSYYQLKDTANASQNYKRLASANNKIIQSQALHQMGVLAHQKKDLSQALSLFKGALKADPTNESARYNYELVKKLLDKQKENEENQQQDNEKDDMKPSEYAKMLKEQAEKLVYDRRYRDAFNLMQKGLQQDQTVSYYNDFISRISDIIEIEQ